MSRDLQGKWKRTESNPRNVPIGDGRTVHARHRDRFATSDALAVRTRYRANQHSVRTSVKLSPAEERLTAVLPEHLASVGSGAGTRSVSCTSSALVAGDG
jgi:hypothetical protein